MRAAIEKGDEKFQFPSNGKVETKKDSQRLLCDTLLCFNSLQTGKWRQRKQTQSESQRQQLWFQFPSNGKVETKLESPHKNEVFSHVSIPFKRESGDKVTSIN